MANGDRKPFPILIQYGDVGSSLLLGMFPVRRASMNLTAYADAIKPNPASSAAFFSRSG
jgi:hypothetical protein